MMTLVSLGVGAGYLYSLASVFVPQLGSGFSLEVGTLVWVLLFGHYLEARAGHAAGDATAAIAKLLPRRARRVRDGQEESVPLEQLTPGDIVLVRAGERVPADGVIVEGEAHLDESFLTGESRPLAKKEGERVAAGTINLDGMLRIRVERVGEEATLGRIQSLIAHALSTRPRLARLADQAANLLTIVALTAASGAFVVWWGLVGASFAQAITYAIAVLVVACPHALGLATPAVTSLSAAMAARVGILIKNLASLEVARRVDVVIFDKTGTLTEGKPRVVRVVPSPSVSEKEVLAVAAALESGAAHPLAEAIRKQAEQLSLTPLQSRKLSIVAGKGVEGEIEGEVCRIGSLEFAQANASIPAALAREAHTFAEEGASIVFIACGPKLLGFIALADSVRNEAAQAAARLRAMGLRIGVLTGDRRAVAEKIARELGIDEVFAEVLPEEKYRHIQALQQKGHTVAMVGDGINDAPALTQADLGIAIGAGTEVAVEAGDVVLVHSNLLAVAAFFRLARAAYRKMLQNVWWAAGYNALAIPVAAGVFAPWGIALAPWMAALIMSASTVIVVINALLLRKEVIMGEVTHP